VQELLQCARVTAIPIAIGYVRVIAIFVAILIL
jgi:hypothetical protein